MRERRPETTPLWKKNYLGRNYKLSYPNEEEIITFHGREVESHDLYGYNKRNIPCVIKPCEVFGLWENKYLPIIHYRTLNGSVWEEKEEIFQLQGDFDFSLDEFYGWLIHRGPRMRITPSSSLKRLEDKRREAVNRLNAYVQNVSFLKYRIIPQTEWYLEEGFDSIIIERILSELSEVFFQVNSKIGVSCSRFEVRFFYEENLAISEEGRWLLYYITPLLLKVRRLDMWVKEKRKELE